MQIFINENVQAKFSCNLGRFSDFGRLTLVPHVFSRSFLGLVRAYLETKQSISDRDRLFELLFELDKKLVDVIPFELNLFVFETIKLLSDFMSEILRTFSCHRLLC